MTRIEKLKVEIGVVPAGLGPLTEAQRLYLSALKGGQSISDLVQGCLQQGQLVCFTELFALLSSCVQFGLIKHPDFVRYFSSLQDLSGGRIGGAGGSPSVSGRNPEELLGKHPFFRSMNPLISRLFFKQAEVLDFPSEAVLCRQGSNDRDLYFVVSGEFAIYKQGDKGGRRLVSLCGRNAVIGEVGFFLGDARTADVVCVKPAKVVRVQYDHGTFDGVINREAASKLQTRFRVVHALSKSPFLQSMPEEMIDPLIFAGKLRTVPEYEALCREGDEGHSCFVVVSGSFSISQGPKPIGVRGPGDAFGEVALFFTQGRRTATAMAQRESVVLEIPAHDFYRLLAENLLLACEFEKLALERYRQVLQNQKQAA